MADGEKTKAFPYCIGDIQKQTDGGLHDLGEAYKIFLALTQPEPAWGKRWFLLENPKFEGDRYKTATRFLEIIGNKLEE
jgi:hypothetical protein